MSIKKKMDKLQDKLRTAKKDVIDLQNNCEHIETRIGFDQVSDHNFSIRIICKECQKVLGFPTKQQEDQFLKR